jgi:hypothetical protein
VKPDYGTATGEEVDEGYKMAARIAEEIKSLPNPAVQNFVKQLVALIRIEPDPSRCKHPKKAIQDRGSDRICTNCNLINPLEEGNAKAASVEKLQKEGLA